MALRWSPDRMELLERAVRQGRRVIVSRRGTEYVVVARRVEAKGRRDHLVGHLPMTGEELMFALEDLDEFYVLD